MRPRISGARQEPREPREVGMAQQVKTGPVTKSHHELGTITEQQFEEKTVQQQVLADADNGVQTTILRKDGSVQTVIGLNGTRYLPDPYPDPLDDVLKLALDRRGTEHK